MHFLSNLQSRVNVTGSSFCQSLAHGSVLGNPTLVVASGIGPGTAALCVMELLQCRSAAARSITHHSNCKAPRGYHSATDLAMVRLANTCECCSDYIKEIIWMGTAGYSPQQGGVIDTMRGCNFPNPDTQITREGDLCITLGCQLGL